MTTYESDEPPSSKRLQLTSTSSPQSIRITVLAAGAERQRWQSALFGAANPRIRYAASCGLEKSNA